MENPEKIWGKKGCALACECEKILGHTLASNVHVSVQWTKRKETELITKEIKSLAEALLQEGLENDKTPTDVMELIEKLREEIFSEYNRERDSYTNDTKPETYRDFEKKVEQDWSELEKMWEDSMSESQLLPSEPVYDAADLVLLDTYVLGQKDMAKTVHKEIQSLLYDRFRPLDETEDL